MKKLDPIVVGTYTFSATVEHANGGVVSATVQCGGKSLTGKMNHQGKHDHTDAQFQKDLSAFTLKLATELAGKIRSEELAKKFTS